MSEVRSAYSKRAAEYAELFDSMDAVHPSDRELVTTWAKSIDGVVIDAGCGPGHWTNYLADLGVDARGIDVTPIFVEHARATYPDRQYDIGRVEDVDARTDSVGGVLAWYSLIHHDPATIDRPLQEFARVLRPGGSVLIGFVEGPALEPFDHAVVTAFRWPAEELENRLRDNGFEVVETHTRSAPGRRNHGAIVAILGA